MRHGLPKQPAVREHVPLPVFPFSAVVRLGPGVSEDVSFDAGEDFFGNSLHSYENMLYRFDMEK